MLKALAYGCAVLALETVFNREMLKNGEYGMFFSKSPGDIKSLMLKIEKNSHLLENFRKKSRNRISENYTWEKITGQYIQLFKNMTSSK